MWKRVHSIVFMEIAKSDYRTRLYEVMQQSKSSHAIEELEVTT